MGVKLKNNVRFHSLIICAVYLAIATLNASALAEPATDVSNPLRLPPSPGDIGDLKRSNDGKIIRTGPSTSRPNLPRETIETPSHSDALPFPPLQQPIPKKQTYSTRLLDDLQGHSEHQNRVNRQQIEIDALLRDEARAKSSGAAVDSRGLTVREIALLEQLQRRHREVMSHEMEHFQTGQPFASFPQYFYVKGPLNRQFAISGIVKFDASPVQGNTKVTLIKLERLRRAALAPRTPSNQDRRVAAELARLISILRTGR
ncbi:MAG: hypothetical protein GKS01_08970 [Alphaproteobacteria bacterium]|nr:hypothetical protein [Alphaproteobacteria bacterium]